MKIAGITLEPKFSLGQIVAAIVFMVGVAIAYGKATNRVDELAKDVETLEQTTVPRTEVEVRLKSIDETIKDVKTSLNTIQGAVLSYVSQSRPSSPARQGDGAPSDSGQRGSKDTHSRYPDAPDH